MEIWKKVKGYERLYEISSYGRIRSIDKIVNNQFKHYFKKGKMLSPRSGKLNYLGIILSNDGIKKRYYIHRLVAENFLIKNNENEVVNHKDFNTKNNNVNNLEWCTQKQNIKHSSKYGRMINPPSQIPKKIKSNFGIVYNSLKEAGELLNINSSSICNQLKGRRSSVKGYIFKYLET
jgi:hypothetical protein